jgi:hypothetical protein
MSKNSTAFLAALGILSLVGAAFGWSPVSTHQELAGMFYSDPLIAAFAAEFGTDVSAVVNGAGALDSASSDHKSKYHSGQWTMCTAREYVYYAPSPSDWYEIDETTRLKYMMHNLGDVAVPIGHSPANEVPGAESGQLKEAFFEGQAEVGSYGSPSAPTGGWYTGTVSDCVNQFYADAIANAQYFAANVSTGFLTVTPWENANYAAHVGWDNSQKLAKVILTDYYLAKRGTIVNAGGNYAAEPGQSISFSSAGSEDPDSVSWSGDGTYSNNGGGLEEFLWDLDNDGQYDDASGDSPALSYETLAGMGLATGQWLTIGLEVVDNEGIAGYDTAELALYPSIQGDANLDQAVDLLDLTALGANWGGQNSDWAQGDFNLDEIVDLMDLTALGSSWGTTGGTTPFGSTPEPMTIGLLAFGSFAVMRRRRNA